jgi:hypothetical protein
LDAACDLLEFQSVLTRRIRERLDVAVIEIAAAVEHDLGDSLVLGLFRDQRTDGLRRGRIRALRAESFSRLEAETIVRPSSRRSPARKYSSGCGRRPGADAPTFR